MKRLIALFILADCADGPLRAEDSRILGEDEIHKVLDGKTLHYTMRGRSRGEEHHFSDGRAVWRMPDGRCLRGVWFARGERLCYFYGTAGMGCWSMKLGPGGYRHVADLEPGEAPFPDVLVKRISEEPVECKSPSISEAPPLRTSPSENRPSPTAIRRS